MFWLGKLSASKRPVVCPSRFAAHHPPESALSVFEVKLLSRSLGCEISHAWRARDGVWMNCLVDDVAVALDSHPRWKEGTWNARFDPAQNELVLSHAASVDLVEALAQHVATSDDAFLVVEGGPRQSFYVQLMRDEGVGVIEAVSNAFLDRSVQLSPGQIARLRLLGFALGTSEDHPTNYQFKASDVPQVATWMRAVLETIYDAPADTIQFRAAEPMDPLAIKSVSDLQRLMNRVGPQSQ